MKIQPQRTWIWSRPERALAFGFGSGLSLRAPGTVGTLYAWAFYLLFEILFTTHTIAWIIAVGAIAGIWICGKVGEELGVPDHGGIVWDEFIAFWLILFMIMPTDIWGQLGAFLLFRFFDAVKPGPIKTIDRYFKTWQPRLERLDQPKKIPSWVVRGFGVMIDDIAAAIATLLVIAIWVRVW
jgi:phosphatidylglycerophosphatase A